MVANIFSDRFYSLRQAAWHGLGIVSEEENTAEEVMAKFGDFEVRLEPLQTAGGLAVEKSAIVRSATPSDPQERVLGVVGDRYNLLAPDQVCNIWDSVVRRPVETLGFLGLGETFFITTKMPDFNVLGDDMENYLMVYSPMSGHDSAEINVTPIRVVCQNTLVIGRSMARETYRIVHNERAERYLSTWLATVYDKAISRMSVIQQACELLAKHEVTEEERVGTLEAAYPFPALPKNTAPDDVMAGRTQSWERVCSMMVGRREAADRLFQGEGTGQDTVAADGTSWGLYNAVVELEDYRRSLDQRGALESSLVGPRANTKAIAFDTLLNYSKN